MLSTSTCQQGRSVWHWQLVDKSVASCQQDLWQVDCYPQNLLFTSRLAASCLTTVHQLLNTRQLLSTLIYSYQHSFTLINPHQLLSTLINSYQHSSTLITTRINSFLHSSTLINSRRLLSPFINSYHLLSPFFKSYQHRSTLITTRHFP